VSPALFSKKRISATEGLRQGCGCTKIAVATKPCLQWVFLLFTHQQTHPVIKFSAAIRHYFFTPYTLSPSIMQIQAREESSSTPVVACLPPIVVDQPWFKPPPLPLEFHTLNSAQRQFVAHWDHNPHRVELARVQAELASRNTRSSCSTKQDLFEGILQDLDQRYYKQLADTVEPIPLLMLLQLEHSGPESISLEPQPHLMPGCAHTGSCSPMTQHCTKTVFPGLANPSNTNSLAQFGAAVSLGNTIRCRKRKYEEDLHDREPLWRQPQWKTREFSPMRRAQGEEW
jgi:hypothetical protein